MIFKIPLFGLSVDIRKLPPKPLARKSFNKVFCIGANKTGTTSMARLFYQLGLKVGYQNTAEVLSRAWYETKNPDRIIRYVHTADAFQDVPFGDIDLIPYLDEAFPESKFILTVRDNGDQWFDSLVRHHTRLFATDKSGPPTEMDLANSLHIYKGYLLEIFQNNYSQFGIPLYDRSGYIKRYESNNQAKRTYFKDRPDQFIEINVGKNTDFERLIHFLDIETNIKRFPWRNKSH